MRTLNDYFLKVTLPDCSASGSTGYVAVPDNGRIIKIIAVQEGAISGANAVINFKTATSGSSNVTGGTITIPYAGDAVGDVRYVEPTALNNVLEGFFSSSTKKVSIPTPFLISLSLHFPYSAKLSFS